MKILKTAKFKTKDIIVYVDLDGVIVDLNSRIINILNLKEKLKNKDEEIKKGNGDLSPFVPQYKWEKIKNSKRLWKNPIITKDGKKLLNKIQKEFTSYYILSSPSDMDVAAQEKIKLIKKLGFDTNYILTPNKELLAKENTLLIDDLKKNIDKFKKAGGKTFHWACVEKFRDNDVNFEEEWEKLMESI